MIDFKFLIGQIKIQMKIFPSHNYSLKHFLKLVILIKYLNHQDKSLKHIRSTNIFKSSNKKLEIKNNKLDIIVTTLMLIIMINQMCSSNMIYLEVETLNIF